VAEWRVTDVMRQADGLDQIRVDLEAFDRSYFIANTAADLSDLQRVCEAGSIEVPPTGSKNLRFSLEAAECGAMYYATLIDFKCRTLRLFPRIWFFELPRDVVVIVSFGFPANDEHVNLQSAERARQKSRAPLYSDTFVGLMLTASEKLTVRP